MAEPDQDIKPYHDNVWVLKRIGLALLVFYVVAAVGAVTLALGVSHEVVAVCLAVAAVMCVALTNWWSFRSACLSSSSARSQTRGR